MNPYLIEGPCLVSFSGGRTSGYMLWHILDAYGGQLPGDVHVAFANTGKEREETLRFVHECESRWGVKVHWLEWQFRPLGKDGRETSFADRFREVGYNSASRNGEPFVALISRFNGALPNGVSRYCTGHLKIHTMSYFMRSLGYDRWNNAVGLRADEMHRVFKQYDRNATGIERSNAIMPMASRAANVHREDVEAWWKKQPFDLGLKPYEGNCDLCFLKSAGKLKTIIRENPRLADWWVAQETDNLATGAGCRFRKNEFYSDLVNEVANQPLLDLEDGDGDEFDAECGLWCPGEAA